MFDDDWPPPDPDDGDGDGHNDGRLAVGMRVRVRRDRRCGYCWTRRDVPDGALGTIADVHHLKHAVSSPEFLRHHVWVELDDKKLGAGGLSHWAADELEPIVSAT